jgi:hypothetical protein
MIEAGMLCSSFKEEIDSLEGGIVASPSKGTTAAVRECTCSDLSNCIHQMFCILGKSSESIRTLKIF